ncbi:MAG: transposase [Aquificaceae bacterium]
MDRKRKQDNTELVRKGEIIIDPEILEPQTRDTKKPGRPYKYSEVLILFMLFIKYTLRLPYRQTEGLVRQILQSKGLSASIPNFRTLHYRQTTQNFHLDHLPQNPEDLPENFVLVLDPTGIKLTNREEWLSKKHGRRRRKGWIRVHIALDIKSKKVMGISIT